MSDRDAKKLALKILVETFHQKAGRLSGTCLDLTGLEQKYGTAFYSDLLFLITRIELDSKEARKHWLDILRHRESLAGLLGRDIGLQAAVFDYFHFIVPRGKSLLAQQITALQQLEKNSIIDTATGFFNYRFLDRLLMREAENSKRSGNPFSLIIIGAGLPPHVAENQERASIDRIMAELADVLARNSRAVDHLVRTGPVEFAVILPGADRTHARKVAQRGLKAAFEHKYLKMEGRSDYPPISTIGLASFPSDSMQPGELAELARKGAFHSAASPA